MAERKVKFSTEKMTLAAILTAFVIVFQILGSFIKLGPTFSITLVLVPIVIGAALCGIGIGGWLGFVFGMVVLISGDAAAFLAINAPATVLVVLLKGVACGIAAGAVYKLVSKYNVYLAVVLAAFTCPIVNTGVFTLGSFAFFLDTIGEWSKGTEYPSALSYLFLGMIGANFLFELATNILLCPVIVRLLNISKKLFRKKTKKQR